MTATSTTNHLVLLGPMGVGKTTIGPLLSTRLGRPFYDSDTEIERTTGRTSRQIATTEGVAALHLVEAKVFLDVIHTTVAGVVAAAASVVDDGECLTALAGQVCVLLEASNSVLLERTGGRSHRRPTGTEERVALMQRRVELWRSLSGIAVDTSVMNPVEAVAVILEELGPG